MRVVFMSGILMELLACCASDGSTRSRRLSENQESGTYRRNYIIRHQEHKLKPYRPSHGNEPYWPDSDWVFSRHEATTRGQVVTCTTMYCPRIYDKFGELCARNDKYEHKTFENYCAWRNLDCGHRQKWFIVYRGKCAGELKTYPNTWNRLVTRAEEYIKRFNESLTTRTIRTTTKTRSASPP